MKQFINIFIFSIFLQSAFAQVVPEIGEPLVQPTVMVIPFAKEGEQLRKVYEQDDQLNLRIAVTKVKEALDYEGIETIDFRAKIKQLQMDKQMTRDNQATIKQKVIELSGADIYVEVETAVIEDVDGSSVSVTANAFDAFSGQVLATGVGSTKKYYTFNFERLTQKAVSIFIKEFTESIRYKFGKIIEEGRTIVVNIGFDENAEIEMDSEMDDGSLFSEMLEAWFEKKAFHGYFHIQGITASKMILDEVRIPVKDDNGRNYRITKFAGKLRNFLKKQGLEVTRDVVGTKIYITIN